MAGDYRFELWDGVSPVNGVSASAIRMANPGATHWLLGYIDDAFFLFQPIHTGEDEAKRELIRRLAAPEREEEETNGNQ